MSGETKREVEMKSESHRRSIRKVSARAPKILLPKFLALLIATVVWLPCMHVFYKPDVREYLKDNDIPSKTRKLSARQMDTWTKPELRQRELQKMQAVNPEWDLMSRTYFVLALANMILQDSNYKQQAFDIIDAIIDNTLRLEQEKGFQHFLLRYGQSGGWVIKPPRSHFVDSEIALMLGARRLIEEKPSYKALLSKRVELMIYRMRQSPVLCAESYPDECWMFCNTVSLAAIRIADVLDGTDRSLFLSSWVNKCKLRLLEKESGLLISAFGVDGTPASCAPGPEGSTIWMACHMLQIVDKNFAIDQYCRARKNLGGSILSFGYSREWPVGSESKIDIDSGPVIPYLGASASASGLAIVAARAFDDMDFFTKLLTSLDFLGFPTESNEHLFYNTGNAIGDSVVLYAMVQGPLWNEVEKRSRK